MTLQQLVTIRQWHRAHRRDHTLECHLWEAMLTCWVAGWMGVPAAVLLEPLVGVAACVALYFAPGAYVRTRARLHRRGLLRCDWLCSAAAPH